MDKELYLKHQSKLSRGFVLQCNRQDNKPSTKKIKLDIAIELPKNFNGSYKHHIKVSNRKWNSMNLKRLSSSLYPIKKYGGIYSKFYKDQEGKVKLSLYGKKILKKKKLLTDL